jgi:hypothetical protein
MERPVPKHAAGNGSHPVTTDLDRMLADTESRTATRMERLVATDGFAELLAKSAENAVALSSISAQVWDLVLRNLRVVSRADVHRLERRLSRMDDKLELVLQEVERLSAQRGLQGPPA